MHCRLLSSVKPHAVFRAMLFHVRARTDFVSFAPLRHSHILIWFAKRDHSKNELHNGYSAQVGITREAPGSESRQRPQTQVVAWKKQGDFAEDNIYQDHMVSTAEFAALCVSCLAMHWPPPNNLRARLPPRSGGFARSVFAPASTPPPLAGEASTTSPCVTPGWLVGGRRHPHGVMFFRV